MMTHDNYDNGFIGHNVEERLGLPCGAVSIVAHDEYPSGYYALVEFDGPGKGQTVVEVFPADTRYGGGSGEPQAVTDFETAP